MRRVPVKPPSFPEVISNQLIESEEAKQWQVLCGDLDHWRVGFYSPKETTAEEIEELEQHDCPELFLLLEGELTLILMRDGELKQVPLKKGQALLVTAPHSGFCPQGSHTGKAFVVERDHFTTTYRSPEEWCLISESRE